MIKFKIFDSYPTMSADKRLNKWIKENPDVEIIDFGYAENGIYEPSICIEYKEATK